MIIKWYNRDNISDVEMRQAKMVANRLAGKKDTLFQPDDEWKWEPLKLIEAGGINANSEAVRYSSVD